MSKALIAKLHQVLDLERQALILADFAPLTQLLQQKEELLLGLSKSKPQADLLRSVRRKMDDNQALLAAAIKGVAAAGERLEALNDVQKGLSVYDPSGRVELLQKQRVNLEKKA